MNNGSNGHIHLYDLEITKGNSLMSHGMIIGNLEHIDWYDLEITKSISLMRAGIHSACTLATCSHPYSWFWFEVVVNPCFL